MEPVGKVLGRNRTCRQSTKRDAEYRYEKNKCNEIEVAGHVKELRDCVKA